jgi:benzodiazapine receptor
MRRSVLGWIGWVAGSLAAAAIGAAVNVPADYLALRRPGWAPPAGVFGPVWTVLYLMMGTAAWLVWRRAGFSRARVALSLYAAQLALNSAWSVLFFGLGLRGAALAELVVLWAAIAATAAAFARHSRPAAALLVPYLAWVAFAGVLNLAVWRLNR